MAVICLPLPSSRSNVRLRHVDKRDMHFRSHPWCREHGREKAWEARTGGGVPARFGRLDVQPAPHYDLSESFKSVRSMGSATIWSWGVGIAGNNRP